MKTTLLALAIAGALGSNVVWAQSGADLVKQKG
jgi:hypothetical protein